MAIAVAQICTEIGTGAGTTPATVTFTNPITAGNVIAVMLIQTATATRTYTCADNIIGSYGTEDIVNNVRGAISIWHSAIHSGGETTVTVTGNTGSTPFYIVALELSGFPSGAAANPPSDFLQEPVASDDHTASASGVSAAGDAISLVAGYLYSATTTDTHIHDGYTRILSGSTSLSFIFEYKLFPSGVSNEVGSWGSTGTDRVGYSAIVLLSPAESAGTKVPVIMNSFMNRRDQ
jgi:hypothetical protein